VHVNVNKENTFSQVFHDLEPRKTFSERLFCHAYYDSVIPNGSREYVNADTHSSVGGCFAFASVLISLDVYSCHRQKCFSNQYFTSCIQALLLEDEKERLQEMVEYLGRKK